MQSCITGTSRTRSCKLLAQGSTTLHREVLILLLLSHIVVSTAFASVNVSPTLEIPFRWTLGQIEIAVSINEKQPIWCILDTGSEFTILDIEVSKTLGFSPAFRRYDRDFLQSLKLSIGPMTLSDQIAMLMPLDNFRRQKRQIRGVIGYNFFERSVVTIDFKKKRLLVAGGSSFHPDPNATVIPLTFVDQLPVTSVTLMVGDRSVNARMMIDTGASQAAILRNPFVETNGLLKFAQGKAKEQMVVAGLTGFVDMPVKKMKLAQWTFSNPIVSAYASSKGAGGYTETDGLLGNDVLRRFVVVFDYQNKKMYLKPNEDLYSPFIFR